MPQLPEDKTKCFKQATTSPNSVDDNTLEYAVVKAIVRPRRVHFLASTIPRPDGPRLFLVWLCERYGLCSSNTYNLNSCNIDFEQYLQK